MTSLMSMNKPQPGTDRSTTGKKPRRPYEPPTLSSVPLDKIVYMGGGSGPDALTGRRSG